MIVILEGKGTFFLSIKSRFFSITKKEKEKERRKNNETIGEGAKKWFAGGKESLR